MKSIIVTILALAAAPLSLAWTPRAGSLSQSRRSSVSMSAVAEGIRMRDVKRKVAKSTKETFEAEVYNSKEIEDFVRARGTASYPKLKKLIHNKAKELGVAKKEKFASKPYTGPPLWLKGAAAEALKAAIAKGDDVAALESAVEGAETLEGIAFVKEGEESPLLNEAKELIEKLQSAAAEEPAAEEPAAEAEAAEEPAAAEEEAAAEPELVEA